jgi:hypothetical protein
MSAITGVDGSSASDGSDIAPRAERTLLEAGMDELLRNGPAGGRPPPSLLRDPETRLFVRNLIQALAETPAPLPDPNTPDDPTLKWSRDAAELLGSLTTEHDLEAIRRKAGALFTEVLAATIASRPIDAGEFAVRAPFIEALNDADQPHWASHVLSYLSRRPEASQAIHDAASRDLELLRPFIGQVANASVGDNIVEAFRSEGGIAVLEACAKAARDIREDVQRVISICKNSGATPDADQVARRVLRQMVLTLHRGQAATPQDLWGLVSRDLRRMRAAVDFIPFNRLDPESVQELAAQRFSPAGLLRFHSTLLRQVTALIKENFPEGDDEEFLQRFLSDKSAALHMLFCGKDELAELVAFVGTEGMPGMPDSPRYVDWLCAGKKLPGLSTALLERAMRDCREGTFHAIKPYVGVFQHMLNDLGGVCDGVPECSPPEYKHHGYLRTRRLPCDLQHIYPLRALGKNAVLDMAKRDQLHLLPPGRVESWKTKDGYAARVCRVAFPNMDWKSEAGEDLDWFYGAVERECADGRVMTLVLPTSNGMICIFEKDPASDEERNTLAQARSRRRAKHAA